MTIKPGAFVRYSGEKELPIPLATAYPDSVVTMAVYIKPGSIGRVTGQSPRETDLGKAHPVEFTLALRSDFFVLRCELFLLENELTQV